jgi:hypothetical protein
MSPSWPSHRRNHPHKSITPNTPNTSSTTKGLPVNHQEHTAPNPSPATGFRALLWSLLRSQGTGAPSTTSKIRLLVTLTAVAAFFAFTGTALAAAPEKPTLTLEDTTAVVTTPSTEALLRGTLNPGKPPEPAGTYELGEYEFLYNAGATCTGGSVMPTPPGMSLGGGHEELPAEVLTGLTAGTKYTVCLQIKTAGGTTLSTPVTFTTPVKPEKPETISPAQTVTATTAVLEGTLNPHASVATKAGYFFAYNPEGECMAGSRSSTEPEAVVKAKLEKQAVTELQPNAKYEFCLVATNEAGETTAGNEVSFETGKAAPEVKSTSTPETTPTEALVETTINPNNQPTTCRVEYGTTSLSEHTTACVQTLRGFGEQSTTARLKGLTQKTTYKYKLIAEDATGKDEGTPGEFTTTSPEPPEVTAATGVTATTAELNGTLNPHHAGELGEYEFVYRHSPVATCTGEGELSTAPAHDLGAEKEAAGPTKIENLSPGTRYAYCLRAHAEGQALSPPSTFTTPPLAPGIVAESESDSEVSATGAKLSATVTPGGPETPYRVTIEYVSQAHFEAEGYANGSILTLPEHEAGFGVTEVHLEEQLAGLSPATTYHFRFVIANAAAPAAIPGSSQTFTTQPTNTTFTLPDNRAYEMVTPVEKQGALFKPEGAIRAAASGDAIADIATVPVENDPEGNADQTVSVLSTRTSAGWSSRTISAPHPVTGQAQEDTEEYVTFSEDLSGAVVDPSSPGFEQLSPQANEPTPYVHTLFSPGNVAEPCLAPYTSAQSCYAPLAGSSDDTASPLEPFGELQASGVCRGFQCGPQFRGGTPNLSDLVFTSPVPLTTTPAPTGIPNVSSEVKLQPDIYEYSEGQLQLLSILPRAQDPTEEGSPQLQLAGRAGIQEAELEKGGVAARHAISDNGNRVVLDELQEVEGGSEKQRSGLYLRDVAKGETIRLDLTETGAPPGPYGEPEYMDANSEGTRIFFLDSERLNANSGATHEKGTFRPEEERPDLYECAISEVAGKDHCTLTDLTPETNRESARVAAVLGSSEDGSYVYFAAAGGLGIAPPGGCFVPDGEGNNGEHEDDLPAGTLCNVFVRHDGVTRFVAALSQQDASDWVNSFGVGDPGLTAQPVRVSPNGAYLAFLSDRPLTGYDTRSAASGHPVPEAYLYGASAGTLGCASCDPTGARPAGGASVPGWPATFVRENAAEAYYQPRYLTDEGRLFFNSPDALVPLDVSKQSEVYEYEPTGTGTCTESTSSGSEVYVPGEHGCVSLISTGTAEEGSRFLEASAGAGEGEAGESGSSGGRDVFFLTTEKVLPQDVDTAPDVYDAHECGTQSPCISPPPASEPCTTEASCKAPPSPQPTIYGAPSSATFSGPGNLVYTPTAPAVKSKGKPVKCRRGFTKKRGKCTKVKAKKKHAGAKKASHDRRAK